MAATVTIEVPADREALVRRVLALSEELEHLALTAADGTVFDACESAVLTGGREVQVQMLEQAVARRIEAAEKKGRRSAGANVDDARRIADPKRAKC
jgi:hypothetical protein